MSGGALAVTVVGAGQVGTNLAAGIAASGHRVTFAGRDLASPKLSAARARVPSAEVVPLAAATTGADLVVLAVPFAALGDTLSTLGDVGGCVLVDPTNAARMMLPDGCGSVAEFIVRERPDATIVKAFNTIGAEAFVAPVIDGQAAFLPIAGPSHAAELVSDLARAMGFDAMVIGDLDAAGLLEQHAQLWMHLAMRAGLGRGIGFGLLGRPEPDDDGAVRRDSVAGSRRGR